MADDQQSQQGDESATDTTQQQDQQDQQAEDRNDNQQQQGQVDEADAVAKAYQKLREVEAREREASAKLKKFEREKLPENERLSQELQDARTEAAGLQEQLNQIQRSQRVTTVAQRLNFHDAADADAFLTEEEAKDERSIESALKRLAKEKPYLVAEARRTGAAVNNGQSANSPEGSLHEEIVGIMKAARS